MVLATVTVWITGLAAGLSSVFSFGLDSLLLAVDAAGAATGAVSLEAVLAGALLLPVAGSAAAGVLLALEPLLPVELLLEDALAELDAVEDAVPDEALLAAPLPALASPEAVGFVALVWLTAAATGSTAGVAAGVAAGGVVGIATGVELTADHDL